MTGETVAFLLNGMCLMYDIQMSDKLKESLNKVAEKHNTCEQPYRCCFINMKM